MFAVTKIQIFESNSQLHYLCYFVCVRCSPSQRYKFLKAIHNSFRNCNRRRLDVRRHKDTNFWKQFTTKPNRLSLRCAMFAVTKIQIFESNSQLIINKYKKNERCSPSQRYKFLKAIHNMCGVHKNSTRMFAVTKIQIFESNSQLRHLSDTFSGGCSPSQRYKFLKAIHN